MTDRLVSLRVRRENIPIERAKKLAEVLMGVDDDFVIEILCANFEKLKEGCVKWDLPTINDNDIYLTSREEEVIEKVLCGLSNKIIASELGVSEGTIKRHLYNIYKKLRVRNRIEILHRFRSL